MTVEAFTPSPVYIVAGPGPYAITHPYREGVLHLTVWRDGLKTVLAPSDYVIAPVFSETTGEVTLSAAAAAAHAGGSLYITRDTVPEQGWEGTSSRERGLEAQLDWITQGVQDIEQVLARALRAPPGEGIDLELPPVVTRALRTLMFDAAGRPTVGAVAATQLLVSAYVETLLAAADPDALAALLHPNLAGVAGLTFGQNEAAIFREGEWYTYTVTGYARSLLVAANAAAARGTLGLGALATLNQVAAAQVSGGAIGTAQLAAAERITTDNVLAAIAGLTAGAIGSLVFAQCDGDIPYGSTVGGSALQPAAAWYQVILGGGSGAIGMLGGAPLSGAWRCLGRANTVKNVAGAANVISATLFVRVA